MKFLIPTSLVMAALCLPLASAVEVKPSRLVGPDQLKEQVTELSSRFAIGERSLDPFGQFQNPEAKEAVEQQIKKIQIDDGPRRFPFDQVVDRIPIAAVMPGQGEVMINGRLFKLGQEFPVRFKGRNFDVEIIKVRPGQVDFRNAKNGDVAVRKFNERPDFLKKEELRNDFAPQPHLDLN